MENATRVHKYTHRLNPTSTRSFRTIPVRTSTAIDMLGYAPHRKNPEWGTVLVRFRNGRTYYYSGIRREDWRRWKDQNADGELTWRHVEPILKGDARHVMQAAPTIRIVR